MSEFEESIDPDADEMAVGADAFLDAGAGLEVAVVGAGAVGATTAYDLARHGAEVVLYDRGGVASGSSGRAAGICYDAFADPLDAEIGADAIERFRRLAGDDTFEFSECPYVWLAREGDRRRAEAIREQVRRMQEEGVVAVEMGPDELGERFPAVRTDDVAVAGVAGGAGYADPGRYTAVLAAAADGAGAALEPETPVEVRTDPPRIVRVDDAGARRAEREFDAVVVAAGAHTKQVLETADLSIAMKPYRVQGLTASTGSDLEYDRPTCYDATEGFYVRPHGDGFLAGNGAETIEASPDDWNREANPGFADDLVDRVAYRLEGADADPLRSWAGLCTATPDGDPLVGELAEGIYVATGFHGHGFMRAPAVGQRLAAAGVGEGGWVAGDPTRFDGDEEFEIVEGMVLDRGA